MVSWTTSSICQSDNHPWDIAALHVGQVEDALTQRETGGSPHRGELHKGACRLGQDDSSTTQISRVVLETSLAHPVRIPLPIRLVSPNRDNSMNDLTQDSRSLRLVSSASLPSPTRPCGSRPTLTNMRSNPPRSTSNTIGQTCIQQTATSATWNDSLRLMRLKRSDQSICKKCSARRVWTRGIRRVLRGRMSPLRGARGSR